MNSNNISVAGFICVLFASGLTGTVSQTSTSCDTAAMDSCVQKFISDSFSYTQETILDESAFSNICSVLTTEAACISNVSCTSADVDNGDNTNNTIGIIDGYQYLCGLDTSDQQTFLNGQLCLNTSALQLQVCYNNTMAAYYNANPGETNSTAMCQAQNNYLSCQYTAIDDECNSDFANIYINWQIRRSQIQYASLRCTLDLYTPVGPANIVPQPTQPVCSLDSVEACLANVATYKAMGKAGTLTAEQLDYLCSIINESEQCVLNLNCMDPVITAATQGTIDANNYLCQSETNKNVYIQNEACVATSDSSGASSACTNTFAAGNPYLYSYQLCNAAKTYMSCLYQAYSKCSADDAKVLMTYTVKGVQPLYVEEYGCVLDKQVLEGGEYSSSAALTSNIICPLMAAMFLALIHPY